MPIWLWIEIAFAVVVAVVAVAIAVTVFNSRRKSKRLKQHYGSEYERLVSETGSEKARKARTHHPRTQPRQARHRPVDAHSPFGFLRPLAKGTGRVRG